MRVSIHQPDHLPWPAYFAKIGRADVFVILDTAGFTKGKFQHRCKIRSWSNPGWMYLTIPLGSHSYNDPLATVPLPDATRWRSQHWRLIHQNYRRAPHAASVLERLEPIYADRTIATLADFNVRLIHTLADLFGLKARVLRASDVDYDRSARGSALNLALCRALGARIYLSGPSGRTYLDLPSFDAASIAVEFLDYAPTPYPQVQGEFIAGLSALDLLCNVGADAARMHVM
jgi:hypothetical protein